MSLPRIILNLRAHTAAACSLARKGPGTGIRVSNDIGRVYGRAKLVDEIGVLSLLGSRQISRCQTRTELSNRVVLSSNLVCNDLIMQLAVVRIIILHDSLGLLSDCVRDSAGVGRHIILDLGLTLEYLETHGVPVLGYQTKELPAFYTRKSGLSVDYQVDTPEELAKILKTQHDLGLKGGVLVTNPIPEEYSMDADAINAVIDRAIEEAKEKGIHGKETTPFLLAKVKEITGGDSLDANIQLVFNNAKLAAQTAVAYCKL